MAGYTSLKSRGPPLGNGGTSCFTLLRLETLLLSVSTKWLLERHKRKPSERFTVVFPPLDKFHCRLRGEFLNWKVRLAIAAHCKSLTATESICVSTGIDNILFHHAAHASQLNSRPQVLRVRNKALTFFGSVPRERLVPPTPYHRISTVSSTCSFPHHSSTYRYFLNLGTKDVTQEENHLMEEKKKKKQEEKKKKEAAQKKAAEQKTKGQL
ncbi:DNA translocase FtsK [Labeo rohita]|uniref:DNA translocase FtsK n=1 Tax=Labeo rohita TaxID=84645 RepID=A0ABQ8MTN8_LABRO|nr:DNA translocase FtsK [Labeo rohita]